MTAIRFSFPFSAVVVAAIFGAASACGDPAPAAAAPDASADVTPGVPAPPDGGVAPGDPADAGSLPAGSEALSPGLSCLDIQARGAARGNGSYWIQPAGAASAFQALCDMTADAGGWTLVANYPLGLQLTPPGWGTTGVEGSVFHAENTVFKLADATINALKTTAFRVRARASVCVTGACALDHTLYFKPACTFSSVASSTACSTAYLDPAFATLTPAGKAPNPCAWHRGLVDYRCNEKGGVVTNHDPMLGGTTICVGELAVDKIACAPRDGERASVQIWAR